MDTGKYSKALVVAVALLFGTLGCASTATQKSAGEQIDDTVITAKVKSGLIADPVTKAGQIDVEVFKGIVQLNGFVDSSAERAQASKVAQGVSGVVEVRNNLAVRPGPATVGSAVDDATLTGKVKAALIDSPATKARQINVESRDGVVQLSGFVNTAAEKSAAEQVAKGVEGVKSVDNQIDVKSS
jgi:hyperosmotically inducible protein